MPADAVRPVVILFTDGKHDVKGVPASQVVPQRDALFGGLKSFALLPVGMGLDPKDRKALQDGLVRLRVTKDMPACLAGSSLAWPDVSCNAPAEAGKAVGQALQEQIPCAISSQPPHSQCW